MMTRVRSAGFTIRRASPDHALRRDEPRRREPAAATGHVLARHAHLLAAGHRHAELARAGLHTTGRAQRGDLDLQLAQQDLDARALAAERVELIREMDLLHPQAD